MRQTQMRSTSGIFGIAGQVLKRGWLLRIRIPPHAIPARVRKHPELSAAEARAIGTRALVPYHFQPAQSGNPTGSSKSRREQMAACESAALAMVPEAIVTLSELMRHSQDDRVRTRCAEILLERGLGKPRETPPPEAVDETRHDPVRVAIQFVTAEPTDPIIGATPEPSVSDPGQAPDGARLAETRSPADPASHAQSARIDREQLIAALEAEEARLVRELQEAKRAIATLEADEPF